MHDRRIPSNFDSEPTLEVWCYILFMYEVKVDTLLVVFQHGFVQSFDSGVDNLRRYITVIVMLMMVAVARAVGIVR